MGDVLICPCCDIHRTQGYPSKRDLVFSFARHVSMGHGLLLACLVIPVAGAWTTRHPLRTQVQNAVFAGDASSTRQDTESSPKVGRAIGYYDVTAHRVRIIGGAEQLTAHARDSVWEWDGVSWRMISESGPTSRGNASVAYDSKQRLAVLTGGTKRADNDSAYEVVADTWQAATTAWRPMSKREVEPRDHHALVYDDAREGLLLFGGMLRDRAAPLPTDTWILRAEGWSRATTVGPPGRARTALAYDQKRREVVLFGGVGQDRGAGQGQLFLNDTWLWNGSRWRRAADGGPPGRYAHGMVYDERAGVVLLYSGSAAHSGAPLADMWKWNGQQWTQIPLSGATPGHRYQPVMVYDRSRDRTVLYGGLGDSTDETWEWDGERWRVIRPK